MLDNIKNLLQTIGYEWRDEDETFITYLLKSEEQKIKNSCNLEEVPIELFNVIEKRVVGAFLIAKIATDNMGEGFDFEEGVKQIEEGDVSVTYKDGASSKDILSAYANSLISYGEEELLCYRKLRW